MSEKRDLPLFRQPVPRHPPLSRSVQHDARMGEDHSRRVEVSDVASSPSCDVSIGCSPGRVWETGVLDASVLPGDRPDEQPIRMPD